MSRANPARFDRCVSKVRRSLKKYQRPGNAFAICRASIPNAARNSIASRLRSALKQVTRENNPVLPLDISTAVMTPKILSSIEKERRRVEKGLRKNGLFDFLTDKKTTYHAKIVRPRAGSRSAQGEGFQKLAPYKGRQIYRTPEGDYTTSIDRDSRHDSLADAKAFIREWKSNRGRKSRKNRGARNPEEAAKAFYEGFHGEPSKQRVRVRTKIHYHKHLGGIGKLISLKIKPESGGRPVVVSNFGTNQDGIPALLSSNEKRNQLFIEGGDQGVNLSVFGIKKPHEQEVLGKAKNIVYFTTKKHLRPQDGGTANYRHAFGKRATIFTFGKKKPNLPTVIYDVRNKLLSFAGGDYDIPDEGIDG